MEVRTAWVLHVDLDQFIAAVECCRRRLAGLPVVVGGRGDPTERGVVSTASYEAREFGVGSGMPLRTAARKCPEAVFLPVDAPAYDAASAVVMDTLRSFEVPVEVLGWDEAFMAVETDDPQGFADDVRAAVLDATGLHCSVGIGDNKLRAKIATDFGKPRGTFRLTEETWFEVMGAADRRAVGDRPQDRPEARRPRHRDGVAARRRGHRAGSPPGSGRPWARGTAGSAAAWTPPRSTPRPTCRAATVGRPPSSTT